MNKTVRNIIIRVSMLIGLTVFIVLAVLAKRNRELSEIKNIRISIDEWSGNFFVTKEQVSAIIDDKFIVKNRILSGRDLERIEQSLKVIPQVLHSNAYTDNAGNLNIKIEQRKPVLRVYNLQGESYYMDENGVKFPTVNHFAAKVPVVTGFITERYTVPRKAGSSELKKVFRIVQQVSKNNLWKELVGQYNINEKKQVELIPRIGSAVVLFGDDKDVDSKIRRLDVFYFDVLKKVGWDYYRVINIMYKDQVVCLK